MSRTDAIDRAKQSLHNGDFLATLARRIAYPTESSAPGRADVLRTYLDAEIAPALADLGFTTRILATPEGLFLVGEHIEDSSAPTVLTYGHGDVVDGMAGRWRDHLDPWTLTQKAERLYGRGVADNKGQHSINLAALRAVSEARGGRLGFNVKLIFEMGEEIGSPGLAKVCASLRDELAADVFVASDGPRLSAERPTIFLGCRGGLRIHLDADLREGAHHSGNWGGVLANPAAILAAAINSLVDGHGRLRLDALKPPPLTDEIRSMLADVDVEASPDWGEPGLSPAERLFAWNTLEVLAISSGDIVAPANAIPGRAHAVLQLRFVVGTEFEEVAPALQRHFDESGLSMVKVRAAQSFAASRADLRNPWISWVANSIRQTTAKPPALLPNFGGSLPNEVFCEQLGLPTIWLPHSYPGCSQHAPDEHMLLPVIEESLGAMAGLFWDFGELKRGPQGAFFETST